MPRLLLSLALLPLLAFAGCSGPRYGVFATSTNLGIDADATAGKVVIGYDRTEGFVGPGYPKNGTAPSVFGFIESDQAVFTPKIKQLYATGSAAELVSQDEPPKPPEVEESKGTPKTMVFGTTTSIALRLGYGAAAPLPDSISFGYKRREASVIPVLPGDDTTPSRYVPTLASIEMNATADKGPSGAALGVRQFFATGNAARNLAATSSIRSLFRAEAKRAMGVGEREGQAVATTVVQTITCIQRKPGTLASDAAKARWKSAVAALIKAGFITEADRARYENTASTEAIAVRLNTVLGTSAEVETFHAAWVQAQRSCEA